MKNLKYIICFSILLVFASSCSDFLVEDNKGGIDNETFYATQGGYETLLTASYAGLREVYGGFNILDLYGTDLYIESKEGDDKVDWYRYTTLYSNNSFLNDFYENVYNAIQTTNAGIFYNELPEKLSEQLRTQYLGELRFLRAFYHFILLEQFGGIVINDEYTTSPRLSIPRSTLSESYEFIISEMEAALAAVPASSDPGRVNKNVVNHYLAKVYLTRGWDLNSEADFNKAKSYADAVISNLGNITIPYAELWDEAGENNEEFIFSVQYSLNTIKDLEDDGNRQSSLFSVYGGSAGNDQKRRSNDLNPAQYIHASFQQNDARYYVDFMFVTVHPYFTYYSDNPGKVRYYNPIIWDPNKTEITKEDTLRWIEEVGGIDNVEETWQIFPVWKYNYDKYNYNAWYTVSGSLPTFKKFDCPENALNCTRSYSASVRDIVLARLAETYFLKAEACIALGQVADARNLVQTVIDRPGNKVDPGGENLTNALDGVSGKTEALEALLLESGKELLGEFNGRWPTLRRCDMLKYMLEKYNADFDRHNTTFQDKWWYRPIPEDAITLNEALTDADQNPGY
ncbi:RagB/SusD family nutrient uptake outer membrane protein [uncultured Draconibacterium sp.]|uniref:RagB/SusD family nutrient uptake outer membrane protein n=1 Tax=uncultured Draconibacterium sp. TaxID=1573823 RepID=UPI0025FFB00B|nr:RagB/SusD family nutrient uptake outer membrane protein [uncultured Draconibacterium sp.]